MGRATTRAATAPAAATSASRRTTERSRRPVNTASPRPWEVDAEKLAIPRETPPEAAGSKVAPSNVSLCDARTFPPQSPARAAAMSSCPRPRFSDAYRLSTLAAPSARRVRHPESPQGPAAVLRSTRSDSVATRPAGEAAALYGPAVPGPAGEAATATAQETAARTARTILPANIAARSASSAGPPRPSPSSSWSSAVMRPTATSVSSAA